MKAQGQIHDPRYPGPTFGQRQTRKSNHNQNEGV